VLTEVAASQLPGEPRRRWFTDSDFDLIVWFTPAGTICSFQLCYDRRRRERALTWTQDGGFSHDRIDDGEASPAKNRTPILVDGGSSVPDDILRRFITEAVTASHATVPHGNKALAIGLTVAFSLLGVLGDYFLKLASAQEHALRTRWFYVGFAVYASTAFGWVFVMKRLKLATIGVVYSVSMVVFLTVIGSVLFRESLTPYEMVGLAMAIGSLILLVRFA
jgi:multidrug transporter EmrE-like cation transporter